MRKAEDCFQCGLCKPSCSVFEVLLNERYSPRGKAILMKKNEIDKAFYLCTLCDNCTEKCPKQIELNVRKYREKLTKTITTKANKAMIENIRRTGNPFGVFQKIEEEETAKEIIGYDEVENPPKKIFEEDEDFLED